MLERHAYTYDAGSLSRMPLIILDDGEISIGNNYNPVTLTLRDTQELKGWGKDDGEAGVYVVDGASREVIVPQRFRALVDKTQAVAAR